jgi:hypothetical protein
MIFDLAPANGGKPHHIHPPGPDPATAAATPKPTAAATPTPTATPTATATATATPSPSAAPSATPDGRSTTFQAVEGGQETRSGETLLIEAYSAIWLILMGWLVLMWRKQAALNTRLDDLEAAIDRAAAKTAAKK